MKKLDGQRITLRLILPVVLWFLLSIPTFADIIYSVEEGDSAWSIAVRFGISLDDLYNANGWAEDEDPLLQIGQSLVIPTDREDDEQDAVENDDAQTDETDDSSPERTTETSYIVQPGDNPYTIAHHFGCGTLTLLEYNDMVEGELIHPGRLLLIPPDNYEYQGNAEASEEEVAGEPEPLHYRVESGDNPWLIARKFNMNLQVLLAYNNLDSDSVLHIGDEILVPSSGAELSSRSLNWTEHTIASGDTLSEIAETYGVPLAAILEANNLTRNNTLRVGQAIRIPGYRSVPEANIETQQVSEPAPPEPFHFSNLDSDVTPLPSLGTDTSENSDWHSDMFDFRQIEPPAPSTPDAGVPNENGEFSIDGHFEDGIPWHRYTVRRGDTISQVASAFGITQSELLTRNGIDIRTPLRIGRDLKIPMPRPITPPATNSGNTSNNSNVTWGASGTIGNNSGSASGQAVVEEAMKYLGLPYSWGGTNLNGGVDCSGFTYAIMNLFGVQLERRSRDQILNGTEVGYDELAPGDLVFFHTTRSGISHVGMYIGGGEFIHSSSHRGGVVISPLDSGYYMERFVTARRIFN
ncbi:MAG TPA: LysM peptidoglycan-binding domain-containing protein [bacterium]|jgi:cell wall-associated NlpC family hydrolase